MSMYRAGQTGPEARDKATPAPEGTQKRGNEGGSLIRLMLAFWMLAYTSLVFYVLADTWFCEHRLLCKWFSISNCSELPPIVASASYAVLGGMLGAAVLGLTSFHKYVSVEQTFHPAHSWGYVFSPWLGGVLGLIVFALLQSGLLVFSGGATPDDSYPVANLGFLAIGFLSGFGWYDATQRIGKLVKRFFAESASTEPTSDETSGDNSPADSDDGNTH